jgi:hypothetical protein
VTDNGKLVYYQPQIDDWRNYKQLDFRLAFSYTAIGGKPVIGIAVIRGETDVDCDSRTVFLHHLSFTKTQFPALDAATAATLDPVIRSFLPPTASITISLDRVVAGVAKSGAATPMRSDLRFRHFIL